MTKNQNVDKQADNATPADELRYLDPRVLVLGPNVRSDAAKALDPDFVDSVREHGVMVSIRVLETVDGALHVLEGQRRTLAAVATDQALIPAMVVKDNGTELDRLEKQIHENILRADLPEADLTAAYKEMALFGATAAQIARRTKTTRKKVVAALGVAGSDTARAAQVEHNLTIDQAAAIVEFESDEEAVEALTKVAAQTPEQFEHTAQQLRDDRERKAAMATAREALAEAGTKEITNWYNEVYYNKKAREVDELAGADGSRMTAEEHAACPGRAARLNQDRGDAEVRVRLVCLDYKAHGHALLRTGEKATDNRTPEEREAARVERARVIANNKAWKSATEVRRRFLAENFAPRKTAPKGAAPFISDAVLDSGGHSDGITLAGEWLGAKGWDTREAIREMIAKASTGRAQHIGLVVILAAMEEATGVHTWRNVGGKRYLRALQGWGYTLSEVEQIAAGIASADDQPAPAEATEVEVVEPVPAEAEVTEG